MTLEQDESHIASFSVIALLSGWIGQLIDMALPEQVDEQSLGMGIWLVLPFLSGIAIRAFRKDWKDFGIKPRLKGNPGQNPGPFDTNLHWNRRRKYPAWESHQNSVGTVGPLQKEQREEKKTKIPRARSRITPLILL